MHRVVQVTYSIEIRDLNYILLLDDNIVQWVLEITTKLDNSHRICHLYMPEVILTNDKLVLFINNLLVVAFCYIFNLKIRLA